MRSRKLLNKCLRCKKNSNLERDGEFKIDDYYDTEGDSELAKYKNTYNELAIRLVDLAHAEKGSHR